MIKLVENINDYDLTQFESDVFYFRILSDYKTLSVFENAMFYVSMDNDNINGVISKIDGDVTLSLCNISPLEEIKEFINLIGYSKILCNEDYSHAFDGNKTKGSILKALGKSGNLRKVKELYTEDLKDAYKLIEEAFEIKLDFMSWFADISHKMRHGGARSFGVFEDGNLVSVAFSLFETEKSAVLSSVTTKKLYRGCGFGEMAVKKVLSENVQKDVYVFTENEVAENWYKKLGFEAIGIWSEIENVL